MAASLTTPLRLHGAKAEKLTETANAASSELGPLLVTQRHKPLPIHCPGLSQVLTHAATVTPTHVVLHGGCSDARSVQCKRVVQAIGI